MDAHTFRIASLVRLTLLSLYLALTLPLPILANRTEAGPAMITFLMVGLVLGFIILYGALTEQVIVDPQGIQVTYAAWVPAFMGQGWRITWSEIIALKPRTTGQGGLVYYLLDRQEQGYLLPMRIAGFARFVQLVQAKTGLDMRDVKPLAQPWMYVALLGLTLLLLLADAWTIWTAQSWSG